MGVRFLIEMIVVDFGCVRKSEGMGRFYRYHKNSLSVSYNFRYTADLDATFLFLRLKSSGLSFRVSMVVVTLPVTHLFFL